MDGEEAPSLVRRRRAGPPMADITRRSRPPVVADGARRHETVSGGASKLPVRERVAGGAQFDSFYSVAIDLFSSLSIRFGSVEKSAILIL